MYLKTFVNMRRRYGIYHVDKDYIDEIILGCGDSEGPGPYYEFGFTWYYIVGQSAVQFEAFQDSWAVFADYPEFFLELSKLQRDNGRTCVTVEEIEQFLLSMGFEDVT